MIVFNQCEQYKNLVKNGFEKWPNFRDLMIIGKELKFKENKDYSNIYAELNNFCRQKCPDFDANICNNLVKRCVEKLKKTENYTELPEKIAFYEDECEEIVKITNKDWQKLIFVFCCLSKLKKSDGIYLNSSNSMKLSDVFSLANVKLAQKYQELELHKMKNAGLITVDLKPLLKFHPKCLKNDGILKIEFEPCSNMLEKLYEFNGTPRFNCQICGKVVIRTNNRGKYCKECALRVKEDKSHAITKKVRELRKLEKLKNTI